MGRVEQARRYIERAGIKGDLSAMMTRDFQADDINSYVGDTVSCCAESLDERRSASYESGTVQGREDRLVATLEQSGQINANDHELGLQHPARM